MSDFPNLTMANFLTYHTKNWFELSALTFLSPSLASFSASLSTKSNGTCCSTFIFKPS